MLLEAYFAQINGILQKLSSLSEYVDNTEDYINIMLDDKQNQLLQVSIIFNTINMIVNAGIVVVGLFGMNIHIDLFDGQPRQFWATIGGTVLGCVLLFLASIWFGKKRYLLS
ncbi:putative Mg2+ transporter protein, CorA-like/Zinc transport protein ZntB [Medicago truncatula]|uniref:Putative Mg2+ transporter protein, CorA-like/Zinc transport protein ZntB n=2 Tax=Medicago truncatula TaxID=3880 RepID=A0A396GSA9_MEDTR|nr:putative Mg2+ transporter protein, CorA-like/Zinc transport protein ZntB [Medicago truncatula]